jgi:hypothetical protein
LGASYVWLASQDEIDLRFIGRPLLQAGVPEWLPRYRGLTSALAVEAGVEGTPALPLRLGARLRFETSAVPVSAVAIDQLDAPKLQLGAGLEVRVANGLALVVGERLGLYLPQDVPASAFTPSAQIACNASGYDLESDACAAARVGRAVPTAAGSYKRIDNELTLGLSYDLW